MKPLTAVLTIDSKGAVTGKVVEGDYTAELSKPGHHVVMGVTQVEKKAKPKKEKPAQDPETLETEYTHG